MSQINALTQILITPEAQAEMSQAQTKVQSLATAAAWPCDSPEDEAILGEFLSAIQRQLRDLETARKKVADPLTHAKRALDELFGSIAQPYEAAKEAIVAKLSLAENARKAAHAAAKALAVATQDPQERTKALAVANTTATKTQGSFREVWTWDIVDLKQVPEEFLALNPVTLRKYVERFKNSETIEGVPGLAFTKVSKAVAR